MGAAAVCHEPAHALWPEDPAFETGDAAHVVVGDQVVDQLQTAFVPDRLDEQTTPFACCAR